jgi:hypothetical protein
MPCTVASVWILLPTADFARIRNKVFATVLFGEKYHITDTVSASGHCISAELNRGTGSVQPHDANHFVGQHDSKRPLVDNRHYPVN